MATETLNREQLINEIWKQHGKIGLVARSLGVHVNSIYNYAKKYATVQTALDNARLQFDTTLVDTAEMGLQKAVIEVQAWAIRYTLSTKGKDRGYVEKSEIDHTVKAEMNISQKLQDEAAEIWGED